LASRDTETSSSELDWAPRQQRKRSKQIEAAIAALEQEHHRTPTEEEIAAHLASSRILPDEGAYSSGSPERDSSTPVPSLMEDPVVQILMAAAAAFQDLETGRSWLLTPSPSLGNVAPVSLIATQAGRELVANELGLIEHGLF